VIKHLYRWILAGLLASTSTVFATVEQNHIFMHDGVERHYYIHHPKDLPKGAPLVFALHGMGGNAATMRYGLGLNERANTYGFAVVYPQGIRLKQGSRHWNAGFRFSTTDDLGFLSSLAKHLQNDFGYDPNRTFAMGISMGGFMAYSLACDKTSGFSAIVSVIGTMSQQDWQNCIPNPDISILHIHGDQDPVVPIKGNGFLNAAPNVPAVINYWAHSIGAHAYSLAKTPPFYSLEKYENTKTGAKVDYLVLKNFGHDWPHTKNANFSTVDAIAEFFDQIANPE